MGLCYVQAHSLAILKIMIPLTHIPSLLVEAKRVAESSTYGRFRLGAIIAKRRSFLSSGTNSKKTHPLQLKFASRPHLQAWTHAEISALSKARAGDLLGASAYVARITQDGCSANSRPCRGCLAALQHYGLKRMYYFKDGQYFREDI
jgi:tRNA(Arg) A34 adenosine deaminase TadA